MAERRRMDWIGADNYLIEMWNNQQNLRQSGSGRGRPVSQQIPAPSGERIV
jgi:hypothetical protein